MSCVAIIGLGNPGIRYAETRHNLGFWLIDKFAQSQKVSFREKSQYCSEIVKVNYSNKSFMLVKPLTYMNESGKFLKNLLLKNNCEVSETIIIHDEITLPVGRMKISKSNGDGGHNGVKSVFSAIGNNLARLRLGIGQKRNPSMDLADYVLSKFASEEIQILQQQKENFLDALKSLMSEGIDRSMNRYNQTSPNTI
ncbi:MAG: aminoacyl-tRNA hydrolase [Verrucomicrobiota bacterium]|nr:aminoacyl-tRNA hydrolase [Verrucomicrobiota bacterium]